jgi:hypothetical protein
MNVLQLFYIGIRKERGNKPARLFSVWVLPITLFLLVLFANFRFQDIFQHGLVVPPPTGAGNQVKRNKGSEIRNFLGFRSLNPWLHDFRGGDAQERQSIGKNIFRRSNQAQAFRSDLRPGLNDRAGIVEGGEGFGDIVS